MELKAVGRLRGAACGESLRPPRRAAPRNSVTEVDRGILAPSLALTTVDTMPPSRSLGSDRDAIKPLSHGGAGHTS